MYYFSGYNKPLEDYLIALIRFIFENGFEFLFSKSEVLKIIDYTYKRIKKLDTLCDVSYALLFIVLCSFVISI